MQTLNDTVEDIDTHVVEVEDDQVVQVEDDQVEDDFEFDREALNDMLVMKFRS